MRQNNSGDFCGRVLAIWHVHGGRHWWPTGPGGGAARAQTPRKSLVPRPEQTEATVRASQPASAAVQIPSTLPTNSLILSHRSFNCQILSCKHAHVFPGAVPSNSPAWSCRKSTTSALSAVKFLRYIVVRLFQFSRTFWSNSCTRPSALLQCFSCWRKTTWR